MKYEEVAVAIRAWEQFRKMGFACLLCEEACNNLATRLGLAASSAPISHDSEPIRPTKRRTTSTSTQTG